MKPYHALRVAQFGETIQTKIEEIIPQKLNDKEVRVKVTYSSINYKDALATKENGGVLRSYPMTPGIDLVGTVVESSDEQWSINQKVLVTGFGLGVQHPGGFSEYQVVPSSWLVSLPSTLTEKEAMIYGTAGFTAALAVRELTQKITDKQAPIAITGASGGVASIAIALLHDMGYSQLTAITRKKTACDWLISLGAKSIITPDELLPEKVRPLEKQLFAGVLDTVGGELLSHILSFIQYDGIATLCGNASGIKVNTTVLPFILRAIRLVGIDSVSVPIETRSALWQMLAAHKKALNNIPVNEVTLAEIQQQADNLLAGTHQGRTIVRLGEYS